MENNLSVTNLYEKLDLLWDSEQGKNKTKSSLFTLIMFVQNKEYDLLIKDAVSKFPCRIIIIINDIESKEDYLRTFVSSEAFGKIFCDIIRIEVAGDILERVPLLILPHVLPDLPIYLLWAQSIRDNEKILSNLAPIASRIIFDNRSIQSLHSYAADVLGFHQHSNCQIGDLNWSDISGWRKILTQIFNTKDSFNYLSQSRLINIRYASANQKLGYIKAAYLQAWLAARLQWRFKTIDTAGDDIYLHYYGPNDDLIISLKPQSADFVLPGALLGVDIESKYYDGHWTCNRNTSNRQVLVQFHDQERCDIPYYMYLGKVQEGQSIIEEIFYPSMGQHYFDMLSMLASMSW